ncbi:MAG: hypothetical protein HC886_04025 [Leptolyngbyaceae cyanobacterium SM1_1_3]|nr:hypothetical protein [Leptolyngbyaceae cyanobacterium SM1_1_3]NJO09817.1 hypothetical protein [Leptolyngbyaceae cyanobacterium SL_1_1]
MLWVYVEYLRSRSDEVSRLVQQTGVGQEDSGTAQQFIVSDGTIRSASRQTLLKLYSDANQARQLIISAEKAARRTRRRD